MRLLWALVFVFAMDPAILAFQAVGSFHRRARSRVEYGVASWYRAAPRPHLTASGDVYDDNQLTAAHRTLPFGSQVRVTNLRNGRSVTVRINDRGPNIPGRLIDLSRAAAARVGIGHRGITRVRVAVLSRPLAPARR